MKSLLLTGWTGVEYARMAAHTLPLMERYARRHGMDFDCVNLGFVGVAPPSWMKLPHLGSALADGYDKVLWVDADIVIVKSADNILDEVPDDAWQALVRHKTECGAVPNCGLWVVTQPMRQVFKTAWDEYLDEYRNHSWWEQAAILRLMGYEVTPKPEANPGEPTPLAEHTHYLHSRWNHHPRDEDRVDEPAFLHATQYLDRLGVVRECAACAT